MSATGRMLWAVQYFNEPAPGWNTLPPLRGVPFADSVEPDAVAQEIYEAHRIRFLSSVRGRVAVWVNEVPIGAGGPDPEGTYEPEATR